MNKGIELVSFGNVIHVIVCICSILHTCTHIHTYTDNIEAHVEEASAEVKLGNQQLGKAVIYKVCIIVHILVCILHAYFLLCRNVPESYAV